MKRFSFWITALALFVALGACGKQKATDLVAPSRGVASMQQAPTTPSPATVPLLRLKHAPAKTTLGRTTEGEPTLTPAEIEVTLRPGQSVTEHKVLMLPRNTSPPMADVVFCMDLTGSMGEEHNNLKANSINIMDSLRALIPDTYFGVISHMDYPASYSSCGYSGTYGDAAYGDYAYRLDQDLSGNMAAVAGAINALALGGGWDAPEDYTRVLYESYADPNLHWRSGARRFLITWGDDIPHDCNVLACTGGTMTTGRDPGRDGIAGNADDLALLDVLGGMKAANVSLIALHSGGALAQWQCYAGKTTNGTAVRINSNGTIPGGGGIASFIKGLVTGSTARIGHLTLQACDPAYAGWIGGVSPPEYTDILLDVDRTFEFDLTLQVPLGTKDGTYCFEVCAVGDGAAFARQRVCIKVVSDIAVPFDIKPGSCPNPLGNQNGVLPVAILGREGFDVHLVDPATVRLAGVAPIRWAYEDVSTPYLPLEGKKACSDCNTYGADGIRDLTLKFEASAVAAAIGAYPARNCVVVKMTGFMKDGTPIHGEDVVKIVPSKIEEDGGFELDEPVGESERLGELPE